MENSMQIIGYLGADAKTNEVNGSSVINFNVGVTERWKKDGEERSSTDWISCAYWKDAPNLVEHLKKGVMVFVKGKPSAKTFNKDGKENPYIQLRINELQLLSRKNADNESVVNDPQINEENSDIPF